MPVEADGDEAGNGTRTRDRQLGKLANEEPPDTAAPTHTNLGVRCRLLMTLGESHLLGTLLGTPLLSLGTPSLKLEPRLGPAAWAERGCKLKQEACSRNTERSTKSCS